MTDTRADPATLFDRELEEVRKNRTKSSGLHFSPRGLYVCSESHWADTMQLWTSHYTLIRENVPEDMWNSLIDLEKDVEVNQKLADEAQDDWEKAKGFRPILWFTTLMDAVTFDTLVRQFERKVYGATNTAKKNLAKRLDKQQQHAEMEQFVHDNVRRNPALSSPIIDTDSSGRVTSITDSGPTITLPLYKALDNTEDRRRLQADFAALQYSHLRDKNSNESDDMSTDATIVVDTEGDDSGDGESYCGQLDMRQLSHIESLQSTVSTTVTYSSTVTLAINDLSADDVEREKKIMDGLTTILAKRYGLLAKLKRRG